MRVYVEKMPNDFMEFSSLNCGQVIFCLSCRERWTVGQRGKKFEQCVLSSLNHQDISCGIIRCVRVFTCLHPACVFSSLVSDL